MKGVHEINLGQWPQRAYIIGDRTSYRRFMIDRCGGKMSDHPPFPTGGGGSCQKLTSGHACVFVICISKQETVAELACTLAHEATHLMRWRSAWPQGARRSSVKCPNAKPDFLP